MNVTIAAVESAEDILTLRTVYAWIDLEQQVLVSLIEAEWHSDGPSRRNHGRIVRTVNHDGRFVSQIVETRIEHIQTSLDGTVHFAERVGHDPIGVLFLILNNISFRGI